jgi:hypothetical protein
MALVGKRGAATSRHTSAHLSPDTVSSSDAFTKRKKDNFMLIEEKWTLAHILNY